MLDLLLLLSTALASEVRFGTKSAAPGSGSAPGPAAVQTSENKLDGSWIRVLDGCEDLSSEKLKKLSTSGGTNALTRRMALTINGDKFTAAYLPSPKCDADFKIKGETIKNSSVECGKPGTNSGKLEVFRTKLKMTAEKMQGANSWGTEHQLWDYELSDGVLKLSGPARNCADQIFRVYMIPQPVN